MSAAPPAPLKPEYGGAWIGGIVPGLLDGAPAEWLPTAAREAAQVVLLVLDGVGWHAITEHRERLPVLGRMDGGPIWSVAPSTTVAALTSIATGLTPAEHGVIGYRMRVGGEVLNVLQWRNSSGHRGPEPRTVQPHESFGGQQVPLVTRAEFRDTGFTVAHLRSGRLVGWSTTSVLVEHTRRLVAGGERFVYAYYDGVDKVAHEFGLHNGFFAGELVEADRLVGALLDVLPGDCALLVTADHGQIHVPHHGMSDLDAVSGMVTAYAGEGRFRSLFARPGAAGELEAACDATYGDVAWVLTRDDLFDGGWFGPGASGSVRGRIGDVVLAAREPVAFVAPDLKREGRLIGCHGSLTSDELLVPLLAAWGRA